MRPRAVASSEPPRDVEFLVGDAFESERVPGLFRLLRPDDDSNIHGDTFDHLQPLLTEEESSKLPRK
jgi:hypothetical protein